jgi:hypothetical protein
VEPPRALFKADFEVGAHASALGALFHTPYAVAPDGERFLVNERASSAPPAAPSAALGGVRNAEISVVVDWTSALTP